MSISCATTQELLDMQRNTALSPYYQQLIAKELNTRIGVISSH